MADESTHADESGTDEATPTAGAVAEATSSGGSGQPVDANGSDDLRQPADDVEYLLRQAEEALESVRVTEGPAVTPFELPELGAARPSTEHASLELLRDVELGMRIELGRSRMHLEDVLKLKQGSVVTLDKLAGDPVDVYVNGRIVARGEVLVLNDNFCVRVTELVRGHEFSSESQ